MTGAKSNRAIIDDELEEILPILANYVYDVMKAHYGIHWWEHTISIKSPSREKLLKITDDADRIDKLDVYRATKAIILNKDKFDNPVDSQQKSLPKVDFELAKKINNIRNDIEHAGKNGISYVYVCECLSSISHFIEPLDVNRSRIALQKLREYMNKPMDCDSSQPSITVGGKNNHYNNLPNYVDKVKEVLKNNNFDG